MTTSLGTSSLRSTQRQTRTNPTRTSRTAVSSLRHSSLISNAHAAIAPPPAPDHGFFPAITAFTDAIAALPREFRRHTSLLKEVDAKAFAPEAQLQLLLKSCVEGQAEQKGPKTQTAGKDVIVVDDVQNDDGNTSGLDANKRKLFHQVREKLGAMMGSMEEKNHLINSANDDLTRQIDRLNTIYPHATFEVSDEARVGSLTHWAYVEHKQPPTKTPGNPRRDAAAIHDNDIAGRSESRREAMNARKRQTQVDSDFDDARVSKRVATNGKAKKPEAGPSHGLGISVVPPGKKKRAEKAPEMERSLSAALGRGRSREPSQQREGAKKRKAATPATAMARKRINTANSATNSPKIASSPLAGTFGRDARKNSPMPGSRPPARARQSSTQRPPSAASIRNGANGLAGPSSAGNSRRPTEEIKSRRETMDKNDPELSRLPNGTNGKVNTPALKGAANSLKRDEAEDTHSRSKNVTPRLPPPISADREREARPSRARSSKTTTPIVNTFAEADSSAGPSRGDKSKRRPSSASHTSRPRDPLHDSLSPSGLPAKRSHKKGAGLAAQAAALAKLAKHTGSRPSHSSTKTPPVEGLIPATPVMGATTYITPSSPTTAGATLAPSGSTHDPNNPNSTRNNNNPLHTPTASNASINSRTASPIDSSGEEPRYCYCQQISYGQMVACDADTCRREWFHLACVGLERAPGRNAKWFCEECLESREKEKEGKMGKERDGKERGEGETVEGNDNGNGNGNGRESRGRRGTR